MEVKSNMKKIQELGKTGNKLKKNNNKRNGCTKGCDTRVLGARKPSLLSHTIPQNHHQVHNQTTARHARMLLQEHDAERNPTPRRLMKAGKEKHGTPKAT
jgi:hypothetical protein